jgi:amidohydrolase
MNRKNAVCAAVDVVSAELHEVSDWMFRNPEVGFEERGAAERLTGFLEKEGFMVQRGVGDMETAFTGTHKGAGAGPAVGVFAEYDALPDIGHACGHNIIGAAAIGAAVAVRRAWPDLPGTIQLFGSPAEEGGGGKVIMVEKGLVQHLDAAMMIHASVADRVLTNNLSVQRVDVTFHGRTAQPAGSAHEGVSAFEAAILT